jgi:hypothetical protein
LRVQNDISITSGSRQFLIDLDLTRTGETHMLASACKALPKESTRDQFDFIVEGVGETPTIVLLESPKPPRSVTLDGKGVSFEYSAKEHLLWIHFVNNDVSRELAVQY